MKVSDFVALFLKARVNHVFGLQGGAVVHLFDSCERIGPKPIYCHHEQAAAFAAGAYARVHGYGVCIVTTGPGSVNAMTPVLGAWQDSVPMMVISGQTRLEHTSYGTSERQVGMQEAPICNIVQPITKWASCVDKPESISRMIEVAYQESVEGRPGPVWLDLPQDISWSQM